MDQEDNKLQPSQGATDRRYIVRFLIESGGGKKEVGVNVVVKTSAGREEALATEMAWTGLQKALAEKSIQHNRNIELGSVKKIEIVSCTEFPLAFINAPYVTEPASK